MNSQAILQRVLEGQRLSDQDALTLLEGNELLAMGQAADRLRQKRHPGKVVTFIVDRNINYTNVCLSKCKFCAFYRQQEAVDAYVLSEEALYAKIADTIAAGGTQIMLQGGLHPSLTLEYFEAMLRGIKERFKITIHSFSPAEIVHMAQGAGVTTAQALKRLQTAGLDSLPGGGAEILDDDVRRRISPLKISAEQWLEVMEEAHRLGMETTATMVIGFGETLEQRLNHLRLLRQLQDKTGGFRAFIMWTFQPGNTELGGTKASTWEYLKTLALSRLYLDNFSHVQGSWVTQGEAIGQLTLAFGADDLGSIMLEENVVRAAGTAYQMSIEKMLNIIRAVGKEPAQRDTEYRIIKQFAAAAERS